jgi:hypothetical protein
MAFLSKVEVWNCSLTMLFLCFLVELQGWYQNPSAAAAMPSQAFRITVGPCDLLLKHRVLAQGVAASLPRSQVMV